MVAPKSTADIEELGHRIQLVPAELVVCDLSQLTDADCATVDALARLQLRARKLRRRLRLRHVSAELHDLLALTGLCDVLECAD
jgi:ABC-type transporter Mla MlaB component